MCVASRIPDNLHACDPRKAPPAAVISLQWDADVDLDLILQLPDGTLVGGKHPTSADPVDGSVPASALSGAGVATLDRDANRGCAIDGQDLEDIVIQKDPPSGTYAVWVNLFDACAAPAVRFRVSLWLARGDADGGTTQVEQPLASGELLRSDANGGAGPGLFVSDFVLR